MLPKIERAVKAIAGWVRLIVSMILIEEAYAGEVDSSAYSRPTIRHAYVLGQPNEPILVSLLKIHNSPHWMAFALVAATERHD